MTLLYNKEWIPLKKKKDSHVDAGESHVLRCFQLYTSFPCKQYCRPGFDRNYAQSGTSVKLQPDAARHSLGESVQ